MLENLNLLPKTQLKVKQTNQIVAILKALTRILAIFFIMLLGAEYLWAMYTNIQIKQTNERINILKDEIKQQESVEGRYLYSQQVLNSATNIIEKRKNFLETLTELYSKLEQGVSIEGLSFTDNSLLFSGKAKNVQVFIKTLDNFRQSANSKRKLFGNMVLTAANREVDGKYSFKIEIELLDVPLEV